MTRILTSRQFALLLSVGAIILGARLIIVTKTAHAAPKDPQLGAQIVAHGTARGAIACIRCHGSDGGGDGSGAFPILSGQTAYYLSSQLRSFASGNRQNAIMTAIAKGLTDEDIQSVAQYYSSARPTLPISRTGRSDLVQKGQYIATEGNLQNRVQACVSCHGPNGSGETPAIPYIEGQYKHYILVQLKMFRGGYRKQTEMGTVGHRLSDDEAAAVAEYFDQLPLPSTK